MTNLLSPAVPFRWPFFSPLLLCHLLPLLLLLLHFLFLRLLLSILLFVPLPFLVSLKSKAFDDLTFLLHGG